MATTTRLTLSLDVDAGSRGRQVTDIVDGLARHDGVRGAFLVARDGFVVASQAAPRPDLDALAALVATLSRELEHSVTRLGRPVFDTAIFSGDDATIVAAGSPVGVVVALAEPQAGLSSVRGAVRETVALLSAAWSVTL